MTKVGRKKERDVNARKAVVRAFIESLMLREARSVVEKDFYRGPITLLIFYASKVINLR